MELGLIPKISSTSPFSLYQIWIGMIIRLPWLRRGWRFRFTASKPCNQWKQLVYEGTINGGFEDSCYWACGMIVYAHGMPQRIEYS